MTPVRTLSSTELPSAVWSDWSCLVRLVVTDRAVLDSAATDLAAMMLRVERAASRFLIDSELCWANANAGRPTAISRTLVALVDTALGEASRSAGLLDPTVGRDLARLGYDRDIALVSDSESAVDQVAGPRPSWRDVRLDRLTGLLTVPAGAALDLGASAKSRTADRAAATLSERYGCAVLVEIGGDLSVAGGKTDWQVSVAERADQVGQQVTLAGGGLATSSTTIRRWHRGDRAMHHIVDPATGMPADGPWRTVTVAAGSATHANTCSTSAIVLGDEALTWLPDQGVAARLVDRTGQVLTLGGWPGPAAADPTGPAGWDLTARAFSIRIPS
jgi:thiamine biosynthesis lipoprotein